MMRGNGYVREPPNERLAAELRAIIAAPDRRCLACIPTMDIRSPKYENWEKRMGGFLPFLAPKVRYGSAFVTRPDSAPWIATQEYAESVVDLWRGRKVVLIAEPTSKLWPVIRASARKSVHILCPSHEASAHIDEYERDIVRGHPDVAVLSHGVSATVLAHRLACRGIQALDLGSIGGFLIRMLPRQRMVSSTPVVLRHPDCETSADLRAKLESQGYEVQYCGEKSDA